MLNPVWFIVHDPTVGDPVLLHTEVNMKRRPDGFFSKCNKALKCLFSRQVSIQCDAIPYVFDNVPMGKILNWLRVEASLLVKPERPWGWPTHLQIEPTNTCNLRCTLCPVSGEMKRRKGHMDVSLFKRLIDEVGPYVFLILLWDWGEPFMNPHIYEMISYAGQKGIKLASSTNGHVFADPEHAEKVIRSGLDTLIFAVDGISQETYEKYRRGGKLDAALEGVRTVIALRDKLGSRTPLVNFRFIVMRHNEHEIPHLKEMAKSLGVDALTLRTLNTLWNNTYGDKKNDIQKVNNELLPLNHRYQRFYSDHGRDIPLRASKNTCKNLWNAPSIHWDGKVCPCSNDYNDRFVLGDLKEATFKEVWLGRAYRQMRRRLRWNDESDRFCGECRYAFKGRSYIDETIAEVYFFPRK